MLLRKFLVPLTLLLIVVNPIGAKELKTHWDLVENKCKLAGLQTEAEFINDGKWTMKINEDYEILIDVMMTTLQHSELPKELKWYEKKEMLVLLGFTAGFLTAK